MGLEKKAETKEVRRFECDGCGRDLGTYLSWAEAICVHDGRIGPQLTHSYQDGDRVVCVNCIAGASKGEK